MSSLMTLESIFHDENFIASLTKTMNEIKEYARFADNEKSIETHFDNRIYMLFQHFFHILGYDYSPNKEKSIVSLNSGRVDTALANVLIEFKQPKTLSSEKNKQKAIAQILNYLQGANKNGITKTFAMITDGIICAIFTVDDKEVV